MTQVTIRPGEPDEITIPNTVGWEVTEEIGKMWRMVISVERSYLENESINRKDDDVELVGEKTGILIDIETGSSVWNLVVYSYEWAANLAGFTAGGDRREGDDQTLITDLVSEVPDWSAGTIGTFTGPMTYVFNHAHRHEAIRRIERNVPGEVRFSNQGTVDYVDRIGSDRSGTVELSASAGTIEDEITITERGRELDGTHIRVLGAHEGEAQFFANLVPDDDPATYENRVDYTTARWSDGDPKDWDRWENMDVVGQDTIEEEAAALGEELSETLVEANATVSGVDLNVGDTVQVVKPDANLDRSMRIHRLKEKVTDGAKRVYEVLLSTRTTMRADDGDDLRDIQRFNSGWQGSSVAINAGPFGKAVDATHPLSFNFKYPNLGYENEAQLHIKGLEYRIDSQGAGAGGGSVESTTATSGLNQTNSISTGFNNATDVSTSETIPSFAENQGLFASVDVNTSNAVEVSRILIEDTTEGETLYDVNVQDAHTTYVLKVPVDSEHNIRTGNTIQATAYFPTGADGDLDLAITAEDEHTHDVTFPDHVHPPDPGIYTTNDTPSGVDASINGTEVATNVGTGTFETVIDVPGEFDNDAWNTVEVSSDSLGIVEVSAYIEGYAQIGGRT